MAEALKDQFGKDVPARIAASLAAAHTSFPVAAFKRQVLKGYADLELTARGRQIAAGMRAHLPQEYPQAIRIVLDSLDALAATVDADSAMGNFVFMPHCQFVDEYGIEHFDLSMQANYELTQRFTAEFSVRPFIERYPEKALAVLAGWTRDPSEHVRRLVSEGTRPRLPWAARLPAFQRDPAPVLALLELLKDDPSLYVRRSVANNLNDIGKDHPDVLVRTARAWMKGASAEREWLVRHALRSAVKRGDAGALRVLGFGGAQGLRVSRAEILPKKASIGERISVAFDVTNSGKSRRSVMIDFQIHYVKANGSTSPKVFKLKAVDLGPGELVHVRKSVSVADMSTRRHHPGPHQVDAIINGQCQNVGFFDLR